MSVRRYSAMPTHAPRERCGPRSSLLIGLVAGLLVATFFPPPVRFTVPKGSLFSLSLGLSVRCTHVTTTTTISRLGRPLCANPTTTLDRASDPSTFRSNAFFLSRAQHGRHGRRATDHGQRLRGRPNVPRRRPSPGALRPAAVLTAWRRPLAPTFIPALVLLLMMLSCCCS